MTSITSKKKFNQLGLSEETLEAVNSKGFEEPTDIQSLTIPLMLENSVNIIAQAQTGTGKTAAFGLPLIDMINYENTEVQALILVPTRELAIQVSEEIHSLKGTKKLCIVPIYGGQSIDQQLRRLKKGVHIVVGTPGRIIDHLNRKTLDITNIRHLILDEADEMLNMGFIEDMETIMEHTGKNKKTLLFSATMPQKIKDLTKKYMDGYRLLRVDKEPITTKLTQQIYFEVKMADKFEALCRIIDMEDVFYGLVFCRTKNDVDTVAAHLSDRGYDAEAIHGDISQSQRERTLEKFKKQRSNILVATDVAARGIDVNDLTHVINYSMPQDPEAYVHRIGRTGRAGKEGTAITFITPSEYKRLMFIQRISGADIKKSVIPKVEDIIKNKKKKISHDIISLISDENEKIDTKYYKWAKSLLANQNPTEIIAALLNYCFEEEINPDTYGDIKSIEYKNRDHELRTRDIDKEGKARLFVALGKKDRMTPLRLVDLITKKVPMKGRQIRDIQVMDNFSFITVPYNKAEKIVANFMEKGRKPLIAHAKK